MARARDYAAEYAARQSRARAAGYRSYDQQRWARALGLDRTLEGRPPPDAAVRQLSAADMRRGVGAMRRKDFDEADRLARRHGYGTLRRRPPGLTDREWANARVARRLFWYH